MTVSLSDKYDLTQSQIYVSGTQAVIRMLLMQKARDEAAGLTTSGFISGYRGSPLGGLDLQIGRAAQALAKSDIHFEAGINEELAATAIWGTQQVGFYDAARTEGVFSLWYGKGPGVDRAGDVFRHGNLNGSASKGGVLALMGDDHNAESSTNAHATEYQFVDTMMPILNPAGVQEVIDYGLYGYALSRFSGTWVAMKCVKDNIESTASVDGRLDRLTINIPEFDFPLDGLNIRPEIDFIGQEHRLHGPKRAAVEAFIEANPINRIIFDGGKKPRLGIISVGKAYMDTRQALADMGISETVATKIGLRLIKIGCPWPLSAQQVKSFTQGLQHIVVVEEKRGLIESQLKEILYGTENPPAITGKKTLLGDDLFLPSGSIDPNDVAIAIGEQLIAMQAPLGALAENLPKTLIGLKQTQERLNQMEPLGARLPYFCSGCPHNSSTPVPEGSRAAAGIGCHFMTLWMDRDTYGFTQMGGEGAQWVGEAPFSKTDHIFQNIGDGTYNHSGILALRFAVSAGVNVTYKILYNDAVALTGGQANDGQLTVDQMAHQVRAEGVERIALVSDEPEKYQGVSLPSGVTIHLRDTLDAVQKEFRTVKGTSVIIYDQTCAAEKRRRRKRGLMEDPPKRVFINELVCEGCGDCGVQSNCVSIQPVETEFGRKRRIDQTSCNKDFSCIKGFCPSFVTVHGAVLRKQAGLHVDEDPLEGVPEPELFDVSEGWSAILTGIGGTGVITIGAWLGMASHLEGKGCGSIDMAGLAQKGGGVTTHMRIAAKPDDVNTIRVAAGKADFILAGDSVVAGSKPVLASLKPDQTLCVLNKAAVMPGAFIKDIDLELPIDKISQYIEGVVGKARLRPIDATKICERLLGDAIAANAFLLGMAYQSGALPVSAVSIERAITLNAQSVALNQLAFRWGRRAYIDPKHVEHLAGLAVLPARVETFETLVASRERFLVQYQDDDYAQLYVSLVNKVAKAEKDAGCALGDLSNIVAKQLFRMMAIKDEYEVARLYSDGQFAQQLNAQFAEFERLEFHLAPPFLPGKDGQGRPKKRRFAPWVLTAFKLLKHGKKLRGTMLDIFALSRERQAERTTRDQYIQDIEWALGHLNSDTIKPVQALLSYPQSILGFGPVRLHNLEKAMDARKLSLEQLKKQSDNTNALVSFD